MKTNERGIEHVTNEITELVNQVARDARKKALNEVRDLLIAKAEMMSNVIHRSYELTNTLNGERFKRIQDQRRRCWGRLDQLYAIVGYVYGLSEKE